MAFIPVADTVQLELFQRLHGQRIENVTYWQKVGGYGFGDATELWNAALLWWTTDLAPQLSSDITLIGGKITDLSSASGFSLDFTAPTPNPAGVIGVGALPGNVALCVSLRSAGRGRSSRGRNFVAGLPESKVVGNTVDTATVAGIEGAYGALRDTGMSTGWTMVVASRFANKLPRTAGATFEVLTVRIVDPYVDSQRRRLTGRGL